MKTTASVKAAEALIEAAIRHDWNPYLFAGALQETPYNLQSRVVEGMSAYITALRRDAETPGLQWRANPEAVKIAETIDLTEFDQSW